MNDTPKKAKTTRKLPVSLDLKNENLHPNYATFVMDNGAYMIKAGFSTDTKPKFLPNCISKSKNERRRPFIADQIDDCRDTSGMFFILPYQKGYLCKPDVQKVIWDYVFGKDCYNLNPQETNLVITEPYLNFRSLQECVCELLFEEYEFHGVCRTTAANLADYKYSLEHPEAIATLIVDSGYSYSHVIPYINGQRGSMCMKRINVGGKALTNYLKEIISYRQIHVLDESYLINQVKEDLCYVSQDFKQCLQTANLKPPENNIIREYILPDYSTIRRGFIRPTIDFGKKPAENEQILRINNERCSVPEILFHPSDVDIPQMGISETVSNVVDGFNDPLQDHLLKNIVLIGGSCSFPGFQPRLHADVRTNANQLRDVNVFLPENPSTYAWEGGCKFASGPEFQKYLVTKEMYNEVGLSAFAQISDI